MAIEVIALEASANAPFPPDRFRLSPGGIVMPLVSRTLSMDVRRYWGEPGSPLISLDMVEDGTDGFFVIDAAGGWFRFQIAQATLAAAYAVAGPGGTALSAGTNAELVADIMATDADGLRGCVAEVAFTILPGVTL